MLLLSAKIKSTRIILAHLLLAFLPCTISTTSCPTLQFYDEFQSLLEQNWEIMLGDGCNYNICGWGNDELEQYTEDNVFIEDGCLVLEARSEEDNKLTSARIRSKNKRDFTHGYFESRIRLPYGKGIWPAFWMLPSNPGATWPFDGEIDIMENIGSREPYLVHGTVHHATDVNHAGDIYSTSTFVSFEAFHEGFYTFGIDKSPGEIRWMVDGYVFKSISKRELEERDRDNNWPFDRNPYHFILNLAVGGLWPGYPEKASTSFPQRMVVDYIRVYDKPLGRISGPNRVYAKQRVQFHVEDGVDDYSYEWEVPYDAVLVGGQGTPRISVHFGGYSGTISVKVQSVQCSDVKQQTLKINVAVLTSKMNKNHCRYVGDFKKSDVANLISSSGIYNIETNPEKSTKINQPPSNQIVIYVRNADELFDSIFYRLTTPLEDLTPYINGQTTFSIDVLTSNKQHSPLENEIVLQLEDSRVSSSEPYPRGRHSRYKTVLSQDTHSTWQRFYFEFWDQPDPSVTEADTMVLMFAPGTHGGDITYFDNLDEYRRAPTCREVSCEDRHRYRFLKISVWISVLFMCVIAVFWKRRTAKMKLYRKVDEEGISLTNSSRDLSSYEEIQ